MEQIVPTDSHASEAAAFRSMRHAPSRGPRVAQCAKPANATYFGRAAKPMRELASIVDTMGWLPAATCGDKCRMRRARISGIAWSEKSARRAWHTRLSESVCARTSTSKEFTERNTLRSSDNGDRRTHSGARN